MIWHTQILVLNVVSLLMPSRKSVLYLRFLTISICYVCCNLSTSITIIQGLYRSTQIPHAIDSFWLDTQRFLIDFSTCCGIMQWPQNRSDALHITSTLKSVRNDNSRISSNILDRRICQYQVASSRPRDSPKQPTTIQQLPNDKSSHRQKFIKISYFQFWSYLILSRVEPNGCTNISEFGRRPRCLHPWC
jgi:hypothetical protein